MNFVAVFEALIGGGPNGLWLANERTPPMSPIHLVIDDFPIRVVPLVSQATEAEFIDDENLVEWEADYMQALRAEVTVQSDLLSLDDADTLNYFIRPRAAAAEALRRTLSHLRSVTGDASVDTKMRALRLAEYRDESGTDIYPRPVWDSFRLSTEDMGVTLTALLWDRVAERVIKNERVPFGREWLLDAESFLAARNFNMVLAAAAVACELNAFALLRARLTANGRVSESRAKKFLDRVSKQDLLPTLLAHFDLSNDAMIADITSVFEERNKIMHGVRVAQVKEDHARKAIRAAEFLDEALSRSGS